jgi:GT2 family glycosyltransferase
MATVVSNVDRDIWGVDTSDAGPPRLAVVVLALGAPVETVDAVKSLFEQKLRVEIVVVNSGGGGMAALLARHGIDVAVIEHEERLYVGAARNIGIKATRAPLRRLPRIGLQGDRRLGERTARRSPQRLRGSRQRCGEWQS